ncbi:hypothetical protein Nhal_3044 [Nitrosococcus halophilus Nc 4]|uniref:Uncharacterized protein n=1 Tax=Nitrosococcus halophilus (strain Nc4) TaxID=472759 RepID=D5BZ84_NITHN|nr:hypothetical protein Nhal_3044 [Nitrosococcus halophilus Nc 4]
MCSLLRILELFVLMGVGRLSDPVDKRQEET